MANPFSKFLLFLLIILCTSFSCKKEETNRNEKNKSSQNSDRILHNIGFFSKNKEMNQIEEEVFYIDSVLINSKIPLHTTYPFFVKNIGKQDSIKPFSGGMYSAFEDTIEVQTKSLYKNHSEYELYNGEIIYSNIVLNEKTFFTYRGENFTHETTLDDFKEFFPNSVNGSGKVDVYGKGWYTMVRMRVSDNQEVDERINFMFRDGYLESFHWWLP